MRSEVIVKHHTLVLFGRLETLHILSIVRNKNLISIHVLKHLNIKTPKDY